MKYWYLYLLYKLNLKQFHCEEEDKNLFCLRCRVDEIETQFEMEP